MEEQGGSIESLIEKAETFGKTSYELFKLRAIDKTANALSVVVSYSLFILLLIMFLAMVGIGAALLLGDYLGELYLGFLCVGGFYGILGVVLFLTGTIWVKKIVSNKVINHALN